MIFSQAVRTLRVLPSLSVPGHLHSPVCSPGPHFSPAWGCQCLHQRCCSRTSPWLCLLDSPHSSSAARFPDLSPGFSGCTLKMTHYLALSRTMDGLFPITPVLLDFALVSNFMFFACAMVALPRLLAHPSLRSSSAIANPLGLDYKVDSFNQRKKK